LAEAGFAEGRNLAIEYRWAEGHHERLPALASELVNHVAVIVATGAVVSARAAKARRNQFSVLLALSSTGCSNTAPPTVQSKAANPKHSAAITTERKPLFGFWCHAATIARKRAGGGGPKWQDDRASFEAEGCN
jgi:hypothetical protein